MIGHSTSSTIFMYREIAVLAATSLVAVLVVCFVSALAVNQVYQPLYPEPAAERFQIETTAKSKLAMLRI
jgi:hypothetical protein